MDGTFTVGDALSQRRVHQRSMSSLPELPSVNKSESHSSLSITVMGKRLSLCNSLPSAVHLSVSRRAERRGSIQQYSPSQCYRQSLKGSILHRVGVEGQSTVIQVKLLYGCIIELPSCITRICMHSLNSCMHMIASILYQNGVGSIDSDVFRASDRGRGIVTVTCPGQGDSASDVSRAGGAVG